MLSVTVSQRVLPRQPTFGQHAHPRTNLFLHAKIFNVKCLSEAPEVQEVPNQGLLQLNPEEQQEQQQELLQSNLTIGKEDRVQNLSEYFKEEDDPYALHDLFVEHQTHMDANCVKFAAGSLRKVVAGYRKELRQGKEAIASLDFFKNCYKILCEVILANLDSLDFEGVANCVWCLTLGKSLFQIHTEIENYEEAFEGLCAHCPKVVPITSNSVPVQRFTRLTQLIGENLSERNRPHFEFLYNKLLLIKLGRIKLNSCVDVIRILCQMECTDEEVLDKYIPYMFNTYLKDYNQVFTTIFCSQTAKLRYYNKELLAKISEYLQSNLKNNNGQSMISVAEYVATFATSSDDKEQLARYIVEKTIQKAEFYWTSDIAGILYYTAYAHCPEEEYQELVKVFLEKVGGNFAELSDDDLCKLRQAQLLQSSCGISIEFPQELQTLCAKAQQTYIDTVVNDIKQDEYVLDVFQSIQLQYSNAQCGVTISDGEVAIPILVEAEGQKIVVQPVTEKEFVLNVPGKLLESKIAENEMLENLGYQVQLVETRKWRGDNNYKDIIINEIQQRLSGEFVAEVWQT
eukprot:TRINITY_DN17807_c0_g1_i4.p1 TRINITY_DN17807_c0_g1~~TRINITY_DN17807_c0_g1_i4.p1  ORF type:complete len:571 (-),score=55.91 TRINITY_DN17807_c0_g1_i4:399-2111(-)